MGNFLINTLVNKTITKKINHIIHFILMKKLTYFVIAAMAIGSMTTFTACGGSENKEEKESKDSTVAEAPAVEMGDTSAVELKSFTPTVNVRYVDMQQILEKYTYAKQELDKLEKKNQALQKTQADLTAQLTKKQNEIQQKAQNNGYMSQESYEKDMKEYQELAQKSEAQFSKQAQALAEELQKTQETLIKVIDNYIAKYNESKKYDVILHKDAAAYLNPALDITQEIIDGLNNQSK